MISHTGAYSLLLLKCGLPGGSTARACCLVHWILQHSLVYLVACVQRHLVLHISVLLVRGLLTGMCARLVALLLNPRGSIKMSKDRGGPLVLGPLWVSGWCGFGLAIRAFVDGKGSCWTMF